MLATTTALVVEAQPDSDASVLCAALPSGVTAPTRYSDLSSASDTVQETCDGVDPGRVWGGGGDTTRLFSGLDCVSPFFVLGRL